MTLDIVLGIVALALVAVSGGLALAETALTRMNLVKALTLQEQGRRGSATLARLMERPERWLNPLLLLNLACQLVAATLVGYVAHDVFGPWGVVAATAFEVVFIFVVAEAVPKTWAIQHGDNAAILSAPPIDALAKFPPLRLLARGLISIANVLTPGRGLRRGPFVSEQELLTMADVAVAEDVIEGGERALIHSIIEFGDTVVREVMVPRPDMVAVEADKTIGTVLELAIAEGYSRIPVFEEGIDDITGIVFTKDLIRMARDAEANAPVRTVARPAHFVPETKRVSELMREMQDQKFHMAIVIDEYGGTAGLVTLEDLIEELVGEIVDEYDVEEPLIEWLPNGDSRVNARMPVDELNDLLHAHLPESDDWDSVGGLLLHVLGHIPTTGESAEVDGWRLTAERVQGRRISRVRLTRTAGDENAQDEEGGAGVQATLRRLAAARGADSGDGRPQR
ncbi:MAG TPA: hemolysin family protein [Acidimicrobiales bacterium]|nr:hemolysin family protein [Acidimicrobiales bacterium]